MKSYGRWRGTCIIACYPLAGAYTCIHVCMCVRENKACALPKFPLSCTIPLVQRHIRTILTYDNKDITRIYIHLVSLLDYKQSDVSKKPHHIAESGSLNAKE